MPRRPRYRPFQCDFEYAWIDLAARMSAALVALESMIAHRADDGHDDSLARLTGKAAGVREALDVHERLSATMSGNLGVAWRTFADEVTALLDDSSRSDGYHRGARIALTYQRGYQSNAPAPVYATQRA